MEEQKLCFELWKHTSETPGGLVKTQTAGLQSHHFWFTEHEVRHGAVHFFLLLYCIIYYIVSHCNCVCVVYMCGVYVYGTDLLVCVQVCTLMCGSQRRLLGVLLSHSPPNFLETMSLTEPGARLVASKPQWFCCLPTTSGIAGTPWPCLAFHIDTGNVILDPHASTTGTLTLWTVS